MSFFSVNSPLYKFLSKFWDIVKLNLIWLLFCLPIITIGASTVAAYTLALKMSDDTEGYFFKTFVKAFKENFKKATVLWLLTVFVWYAIYMDFQLFNAVSGNPIIFLIVGIVCLVFSTCVFLYAYPLMARYENTLFNTLNNSLEISRRYFGKTVIIIILLVLEFLIFNFNRTILFIGLIFGPGFMIYTVASFAKPIFLDIEKRNEQADFN